MNPDKVTAVFQRCMCFFIMQIQEKNLRLLNFRNASVSHCFRNSSLTIIWNNLGCLIRKNNTYFKKHLLINIQQTILPRTMERLRDATNALEQDDSLLNKGLNNYFLNYNRCFFLNSRFLFIH